MTRNTFAERSDNYAVARPKYPKALFEWIANHCPRKESAWDSACGSGQASVGLSKHFDKVYATDISKEQIAHAVQVDNIEYSIRSAEDCGFANDSFDVITVAQALHWFDYDRFWSEVRRVGRRRSLFMAWGYSWLNCTPEIDKTLIAPFRSIIAPFWAQNNKTLWDGYRAGDVRFPFRPIEMPPFELVVRWTVFELVSYMMTWSAYKLSRHNARAVQELDDVIAQSLKKASIDEKLTVYMPLSVIAGLIS